MGDREVLSQTSGREPVLFVTNGGTLSALQLAVLRRGETHVDGQSLVPKDGLLFSKDGVYESGREGSNYFVLFFIECRSLFLRSTCRERVDESGRVKASEARAGELTEAELEGLETVAGPVFSCHVASWRLSGVVEGQGGDGRERLTFSRILKDARHFTEARS